MNRSNYLDDENEKFDSKEYTEINIILKYLEPEEQERYLYLLEQILKERKENPPSDIIERIPEFIDTFKNSPEIIELNQNNVTTDITKSLSKVLKNISPDLLINIVDNILQEAKLNKYYAEISRLLIEAYQNQKEFVEKDNKIDDIYFDKFNESEESDLKSKIERQKFNIKNKLDI
ncbi:MAG: hypothetical protein QXR31_05060 [Zestosphaera sp.]